MKAEEPAPVPASQPTQATEDPWGPEDTSAQAPCPRCGTARDFGASQCRQCGLPFGHSGFTAGVPAAVGVQGTPAGFWIRFGAWVIDVIIWFVISLVPALIWLFTGDRLDQLEAGEPLNTPGWIDAFQLAIWAAMSIFFHAKYGATPGKMVFNIAVLDEDGKRQIGYARATMRYIGSLVSVCTILIGYIMAAFREDKRSLHDLIANTYPTRTN